MTKISLLKWVSILLSLSFLPSLFGCLPSRKLTLASAAVLIEEVAKSSSRQTDLRMIREGTPAYLMLMEGMIEAWPDNERLLLAASRGYSSFASALVDEPDREYQELLLERSKRYGLKALERRGFKDPLGRPLDNFQSGLAALGKEDVPYLFWAATSWASWISLHSDSIEAVAELPRVEWMIKRVLELDEGFYYGGAHLFMGIWYASRPRAFGGDLKKSQEHFLKAFDFGKGNFLMAYVFYANYYARQALDKTLFISILQKVLETPANVESDLTLLNTVAKKRAKELLGHVEDYFE